MTMVILAGICCQFCCAATKSNQRGHVSLCVELGGDGTAICRNCDRRWPQLAPGIARLGSK